MNFTGIIRTVDRMGRVVIPKEIRNQLKIRDTVDKLEIYMDGENIVLRKHEPCCTFCGSNGESVKINDRNVCYECLQKLNAQKEEQPEI